MRVEVTDGSKPAEAGVTRALRFWVMESSMEPREIRRKSMVTVSVAQVRLVVAF